MLAPPEAFIPQEGDPSYTVPPDLDDLAEYGEEWEPELITPGPVPVEGVPTPPPVYRTAIAKPQRAPRRPREAPPVDMEAIIAGKVREALEEYK